MSRKPEGVVSDFEWIRPGADAERQKIVEVLLDKGADMNKMDYHDHSPLHYACVWGRPPRGNRPLEIRRNFAEIVRSAPRGAQKKP